MLSKDDDNDDEIIKILLHLNEYAETMNQSEKKKIIIIINKLNDHLDKIIEKSKSFEYQIESLEKVENLDEYYFINDFDDRQLESKIFKIELAHLSNIIDKKLFEQIFGHRLIKFANKLINGRNKEGNQIIVKNIDENKEKLINKIKYMIG